jgi:hypothetical protein
MRFVDKLVNREEMYSIGEDLEAGGWYLSIPVSAGFVDYEEYYSISLDFAKSLQSSSSAAIEFANQCRRREHDNLLIFKPGSKRGSAI